MRIAQVWLLIGWLIVGSPNALTATSPPPDAQLTQDSHPEAQPEAVASYAGRTLEEALLALSEQGLNLIFSERLVPPDLRVESEPPAGSLREILVHLLRPHGLTTREGTGGVLIVVPAALEVGRLRGTVREWQSGQPLAEVQVRVTGTDLEVVTDGDGAFSIDRVTAGRHFLQATRPGYMVLQTDVGLTAEQTTEVLLELRPMAWTTEEIDVRAERVGLLGEAISTLRLDRQELLGLPRLGDDVLRPVTLLPGTTGNDLSARFHVRGGRTDEVMVRLDGFEILEPFHLKDFNSALGIVSPEVVGETELLTGAFPVQYGDRLSGVLDLTSREPSWSQRTEVGLSVLFAEASSSGSLSGARGHWLAALRLGSLEPVADLANEAENPSFSDVFGKIVRSLGPGRSLRGNFLASADRLDFTEVLEEADEDEDEPPDRVQFRTSYDNGYAWLSHQAVFARDFFVDSKASISRVQRDRQGNEEGDIGLFSLSDRRRLIAMAGAQDFSAQISNRHELKWGYEVRRLDADFDYRNSRELDDPLAVIGHRSPESDIAFLNDFQGEHYAIYVGDRFRPTARLSAELGLRYDKNTVLDDSDFSPRLSLSYLLKSQSRLRLGWGLFHQSQRIYELQVEDGETRFFPSERSEHRVLGFEHTFGSSSRQEATPGQPTTLRIELYEHRISDPRPRFENLYDPISLAPEVEPDRVRIAPTHSRSRGLEIFATGGGRRVDWFASYALSRIEDRLEAGAVPAGGANEIVRSVDQPHALKLGLSVRTGLRDPRSWRLHLALEMHTGWPTTRLDAQPVVEDGEVEVVPILGPLYGERLPTYRRLDLRASRRFALSRGELELVIDVQNLLDVDNVRGFDVSFNDDEDEEPGITFNRELWSGLAPSFGIRWAF